MAIPVIAIPEQGQILARPRFEPLYDTEAYRTGAALGAGSNPQALTIYKNSSTFANAIVQAIIAKQKKRDTNLDAVAGLSIGQAFQWYSLSLTISGFSTESATTAAVYYDQLRRLREAGWVTFNFAQRQPYFTVQAWQVPDTHVMQPSFTTLNNVNLIGPSQESAQENCYDVTLGGEPVQFDQLETWSLDFTTADTWTPTIYTLVRPKMNGIFLRGLQG